MKLNVSIITPEEEVLKMDNVEWISIPTEVGVIVVYPQHENLMSKLVPGEIIVKTETKEESIVVSDGVVTISDRTTVLLLVETAEKTAHIDLKKAEEAKKRAEDYLKEFSHDFETEDFIKAQAVLLRELAKIRAVRKRRGR